MEIITGFDMDFSSVVAAGESRFFEVTGSNNASFEIEFRNEDSYYYNFFTQEFQEAKSVLSKKIISGRAHRGSVKFPAVTDNDQYDISITATGDTRHSQYSEVRVGDGSVDINSTTGSNSRLITKVIYQYVDLVLTMRLYSPNATIAGTAANDTIAVSAGAGLTDPVAFSTTFTVANDKALRIIKQPTHLDILSFVAPPIGAAPITIPGENTYPTATAAFTGDDINGAITSGTTVDTDATDISANVAVGDKITTPVTTDTVNGARDASAVAVTMDAAVATKMAVGDQVTGNAALDAGVFTVASLDSTNVFSLSSAVAIADGVTLTFSSKINRSLTTVTAFPVDASAFSISQAIQFRDNAPLTFFNQMNHSWGVDNANGINQGMIPITSNITSGSVVGGYLETISESKGTKYEKTRIIKKVPAVSRKGQKPTLSRNGTTKILTTTQLGDVTFNKQQKLLLAGDEFKLIAKGKGGIKSLVGWDVAFSNLTARVLPVKTTTTQAVSNSATVTIASGDGIMDDVSTVSGIGITGTPLVTTLGSYSGSTATVTFSNNQTLENGIDLNFHGAGETVVVSGEVEVLNSNQINPDWNGIFYLDIESFVTATVET